ncbi:ribbon-helix-helix protein, CopG family [Candidatus Woesearchaeota archaeon]|nr:ribbon-helix-helix protein, CopG family [Candidatus Woesearchaeota archaeon]
MVATTATVNIRLPKEVSDILDTLVERKLFANRSEAIREFCRDYLEVRR